jgi:hypothetical protein
MTVAHAQSVVAAIASGQLRPISSGEYEEEKDAHRVMQRAKQIARGKDTLGYDRYRLLIGKRQRQSSQGGARGVLTPSSPDPRRVHSKRGWDMQARSWRRALHAFDLQYELHVGPFGAVTSSSSSSSSSAGHSARDDEQGGREGAREGEGGDEGADDAVPVDKLPDGRFRAQDCPASAYPILAWLYASCDRNAIGSEDIDAGDHPQERRGAPQLPFVSPLHSCRLRWPVASTAGPLHALELSEDVRGSGRGAASQDPQQQQQQVQPQHLAPGPVTNFASIGDTYHDDRAMEGVWGQLRKALPQSGSAEAASIVQRLRPTFPPRSAVTPPSGPSSSGKWREFERDPLLCGEV